MKEGRLLRTLRHSNTKSAGMLQPFSEVIHERNESCEFTNSKNSLYSWKNDSSGPKFSSNTTGKKTGANKVVTNFRHDYLK